MHTAHIVKHFRHNLIMRKTHDRIMTNNMLVLLDFLRHRPARRPRIPL